MSVASLPTPVEFGLPDKFSSWRRGQGRAFQQLLHSEKRFVVLALPTGVGKGATYLSYIMATGQRACTLTATKGLQSQLQQDFPRIVTDVRGMGNYPCKEYGGQCDTAPCLDGRKCRLRGSGCYYYDAVARAGKADVPSTNYAFWMSHEQEDLGEFDVLVCDEGHEVMDEIGDRMRVAITKTDMAAMRLGELTSYNEQAWWRIANAKAQQLEKEHTGKRRQHYKRMGEGVVRLATSVERGGRWVRTSLPGGGWAWEPLWPGEFAEAMLWRGVPKVIVSSATITKKQMGYLGVGAGEFEWVGCPSPFPVHRRAVTIVKGAPKLNAKSSQEDWGRWRDLIDGVAAEHVMQHKGVVHSVSFDRAEWLKANSRWGDHMLLYRRGEAEKAVELFRKIDPPAILVGPSLHTGYDFAHDECRWQVIGKVPFPDPRDPIVAARTREDRDYPFAVAIAKIAQAAGRATRQDGDWSQTYIVDGHAGWLLWGHKGLVPPTLLEALRNG